MTDRGAGPGPHTGPPEGRDAPATEPRGGIRRTLDLGDWRALMWWPADAGGGPAEITIEANPGGDPGRISRGINSTVLRSVPLAQATEEVRRLQRSAQESEEGFSDSRKAVEELTAFIRDVLGSDPRPGRRGRSDRFFATVAAVHSWYVDLQYPNPVQQIATACGSGWTATANWVRTAREKGFLTEADREHPHGTLTDEARSLLASAGDPGR